MDLFRELGQGAGPEAWSQDKLGRLQAAAIAGNAPRKRMLSLDGS